MKRIDLLMDTELALCFGRDQCAKSSYLKTIFTKFVKVKKNQGLWILSSLHKLFDKEFCITFIPEILNECDV